MKASKAQSNMLFKNVLDMNGNEVVYQINGGNIALFFFKNLTIAFFLYFIFFFISFIKDLLTMSIWTLQLWFL